MAEEACYLGKEDGITTCESCWAKMACGKNGCSNNALP